MKALIAAALLAAGNAMAGDFIFTHGQDSIILTMAPCELPIPQKDSMLAAKAKVGGQDYAACWVPMNKEAALLIYEDGDQGYVLFRDLRPLPEV